MVASDTAEVYYPTLESQCATRQNSSDHRVFAVCQTTTSPTLVCYKQQEFTQDLELGWENYAVVEVCVDRAVEFRDFSGSFHAAGAEFNGGDL